MKAKQQANLHCNLNKNEILMWINNLLKVNLTKIEQLGSGSIFCQLFDLMYPNSIALKKVNWHAKFEFEFEKNFKLLQCAFNNQNINKYIYISKLIKAKVQDNLEFAQWFKAFFDQQQVKEFMVEYNPVQMRGGVQPSFPFCQGGFVPKHTMIFGKKEHKKDDGFHEEDYLWEENGNQKENIQNLCNQENSNQIKKVKKEFQDNLVAKESQNKIQNSESKIVNQQLNISIFKKQISKKLEEQKITADIQQIDTMSTIQSNINKIEQIKGILLDIGLNNFQKILQLKQICGTSI